MSFERAVVLSFVLVLIASPLLSEDVRCEEQYGRQLQTSLSALRSVFNKICLKSAISCVACGKELMNGLLKDLGTEGSIGECLREVTLVLRRELKKFAGQCRSLREIDDTSSRIVNRMKRRSSTGNMSAWDLYVKWSDEKERRIREDHQESQRISGILNVVGTVVCILGIIAMVLIGFFWWRIRNCCNCCRRDYVPTNAPMPQEAPVVIHIPADQAPSASEPSHTDRTKAASDASNAM
uniref:Saposin B-type domain-containing protein n=1 Tax=Steinernema glaseri TaxID=37863 RepID=A0A1I7YBK2_9BILA